jgi:hypothetical protein
VLEEFEEAGAIDRVGVDVASFVAACDDVEDAAGDLNAWWP